MFSLSLKAQDCFLWISLRVGPMKRNQEGSMPALIRVAQSERKHCTLSIIFFPPHSLIYVEIVSMQHQLNSVCLTLMKKKPLLSWRIQPANIWTIGLQILCLCVVAWPWFLCINECSWAAWGFLKEARAALQLLLDQRTWTESQKASWEQWIASACCPALDFNSCGPFTSQQDPAVTSQQAFSCFLEAIGCRFTC